MHHLASRIGMRQLGESLEEVMPRPTENVLLLAWVLPSFLQGVSGFGTPIAVCAPLLVAIGVDATRAVALPLIGYHWAVGFGSMGSSFYMGALTAHLTPAQTHEFAVSTSIVLGVNVLLSGTLVALMWGGLHALREGWRVLLCAGAAMALVQGLVVHGEPAIGALCGGAAGLAAVLLLRAVSRRRRAVPVGGPAARPSRAGDPPSHPAPAPDRQVRARAAAAPYVLLAVAALLLFIPPAARSWVKTHALLGPDFPATRTGEGASTAAVTTYNPIALLGHPGTLLLLASVASVLIWRRAGLWPDRTWADVRSRWLRQSWRSTPAVVLLASVAGVLVESGMVRAVAIGAAAATGRAYPLVTPFVGAMGSFVTGSTTSSNALFAALQADVARLVGDRPADLLAAQTAGGNVGNSLAPVVIALGVTAVGASTTATAVLRRTVLPALALLASLLVTTQVLVLVHR
jgi:lactate permease